MSVQTPKYRLHKGSGQALVQINGQRLYLGVYGSDGSKQAYRRLVAERLASNPITIARRKSAPSKKRYHYQITPKVDRLAIGWR
jgi:hypothetical protein